MHIVHGELRKAPYIKQGVGADGQSTLFIVELSEVTKDRQTGDKSYANYSAALFAKSPAQINHYTNQLVEGNFIVVNCEKLRVDVQDSNGKQYIKLQMENARLEGTKYIDNQQQAPQQGFQQAPPQQAPQQQFAPQQQQQAPQQFAPQQMQQAPTLAQQAAQHPQAQPANFDNSEIPF
tara:strand:- start:7 stop:540 length:534 start_codon:yes stop_codon:yes gene_type:complete